MKRRGFVRSISRVRVAHTLFLHGRRRSRSKRGGGPLLADVRRQRRDLGGRYTARVGGASRPDDDDVSVLVLFGVRQRVRPIRFLEYLHQALLGRGRQRVRAALFFGAQQSSAYRAHFGRQVLKLLDTHGVKDIAIRNDVVQTTTTTIATTNVSRVAAPHARQIRSR